MNTTTASAPLTSPIVPDALKLSPGETLLFAVKGRGNQVYEWVPKKKDPTKYEWDHIPEADLFDFEGNKVGSHYAGPTWESNDGSKVICEIKAHAAAPAPNAAPWLLLPVKSHEGQGIFSAVTCIRRMDTVGGGEPSTSADQVKAGQVVRVPYTATYYCYGSKSQTR